MQGVDAMYGRLGPDSGGDQHVAELLKRTYTKLREVQVTWKTQRDSRLSGGKSVYALSLPEMTILYNHWLSSLLWQVAMVFTDGAVVHHYSEDALPQEVYQLGDDLCDDAATHSRLATRLQAQFDESGKVPLSQIAVLPRLPNNNMTYLEAWDSCNEIVNQVKEDLDYLSVAAVPTRMAEIHASIVKGLRTRFTAVDTLRQDWEATSMSDNHMELTKELLLHTTEIFKFGQQLWAPYFVGQKFKEALQKEKSVDELDLAFDPWILTDPRRKQQVQANPAKVKELIGFWDTVINKDAIPTLVGEVEQAVRSGAIRRRVSRGYTMIPWQSQFLVIHPVTLGGVSFEPRQLCAYYPTRKGTEVTIEMRRAGAVRNILELLGQI